MAKSKKISKGSKRRLALFGTVSLIIIFYFIFSSGYHIYKIYTLKNQEKNLSQQLLELQEKEQQLSNDMEKLKDPEYLAKYAREAYSYSKEDEIIIQKYEEEKEDDENTNSSFTLNQKYILVICIIIFGLVAFYIIIKVIKHNKKR